MLSSFFLHGFSSGFFLKRHELFAWFDKVYVYFWQSPDRMDGDDYSMHRLNFFPHFLKGVLFPTMVTFAWNTSIVIYFNKFRIRLKGYTIFEFKRIARRLWIVRCNESWTRDWKGFNLTFDEFYDLKFNFWLLSDDKRTVRKGRIQPNWLMHIKLNHFILPRKSSYFMKFTNVNKRNNIARTRFVFSRFLAKYHLK